MEPVKNAGERMSRGYRKKPGRDKNGFGSRQA